MKLTKVISAKIQAGVAYVKYLGLGKSDIQETPQISPYGIDSVPIKDMVGLYIETGVKGENALIGYIFKNAVALPGEIKLYSQNDAGAQQAFIHLKNDGYIEMNGDEDRMVRFSKLEEGFNQLRDDYNDFIDNNWNQFCTGYVAGGPAVQGQPLSLLGSIAAESTASIANAKIEKIKTSAED